MARADACAAVKTADGFHMAFSLNQYAAAIGIGTAADAGGIGTAGGEYQNGRFNDDIFGHTVVAAADACTVIAAIGIQFSAAAQTNGSCIGTDRVHGPAAADTGSFRSALDIQRTAARQI